MTTLAEDFETTFGPALDNKLFATVVRSGTPAPYAVYVLVSGEYEWMLDGATPNLAHGIFQIDLFAADKLVVDTMAQAVQDAAVAASLFKVGKVTTQDIWEDARQYYRVLVEVSVWR